MRKAISAQLISLEGKCKINEALYREIEARKVSAGEGLTLFGPLLKGTPTQKLLTFHCPALRKIVPYQFNMYDKRYKGLQRSSENVSEISAQ